MTPILLSSGLADASPKIDFITMASPNIIEVVVHAGQVHVGRQVPYVKQAGDVIQEIGHNRTLVRNGKRVGVLIGADSDVLRPYDTFSGDGLDTIWADSKASYWIESATDSDFAFRVGPQHLLQPQILKIQKGAIYGLKHIILIPK